MTGHVKRVLQEKRFGFILNDHRQEYFFHMEDFIGNWEKLVLDCSEGKRVAVLFEAGKTDRGLRARDVRRVEE